MHWLARSELRHPFLRLTTLGTAVRFYAGLSLLGVMCLLISPAMLVAGLVMNAAQRRAFARRTICWVFRNHLAMVQWLGVIRLNLEALDALRAEPAMVIAPNHPSMIDAALVLSRLPNLACIMKADILQSVLFGSGARMAGYIANEPPREMLRAAVADLQAGRHLLLFPEGTRTLVLPINPLQRMVGVVARRANVPVQTIVIETDSPFLCKRWPILRVPRLPMVYTLRLGQRFEPPTDVDAFTAQLDTYFHTELAHARLPALPVTPDSR